MKTALFILLMSITVSLHSQRIDGKYKDNFGHTLEIKSDSTFKFEWKFDLTYTWVKGEWTKEKDLLYLNYIAVYDTLVRSGQPDSLVLSTDPISSKINNEEFIESLLTSGGQKNNDLSVSSQSYVQQLILRKQILFLHVNKSAWTKN
ncbi:hypothetical protein [Roseivirga pacifica]|uniref:hypothetical protein n=1 Tax=Roseivirga pacifica TaxID=1267423 RepID=UPI00209628B7|nr:hypothetical protein [Roseivirga pacifica]MCO6358294.1 hypothetical protein [Roseivirga pacifica]MCO6366242.1 hypothetical protein [Roseivirga pacifica]MCO6369207.1 hypothetical protein [Roseivirga pacifica]MCO6374025.1 hypothetical protein [Roseivirga pacifica]MCO6378401.1 hypothetical protein [Roseivirga pacifica]